MGIALSLLPVAAYLTGAIEMLWKVGVAIGQFGTGFVFSPKKWAGIGVTGLAFALFLAPAAGRAAGPRGRRARRPAPTARPRPGSPASPALAAATTTPGTQILPAGRQRVPADRAPPRRRPRARARPRRPTMTT